MNTEYKPVNPNANKETVELLSFLYELKGEKVISAHHDFIGSDTRISDSIAELTGKQPLIWGSDLSFFYTGDEPRKIQHCGPMNLEYPGKNIRLGNSFASDRDVAYTGGNPCEMRTKLVERIIDQHRKGHIITLMWHCPRPEKGDRCEYRDLWAAPGDITDEWWKNLITPGTELHAIWKKQIDTIAPYLKRLQEAGVPILWRPYHEMNGVWFWWGDRNGPDGFRKLWIQLFDRLTLHHGIDNLIWVWNTNAPRDTEGDEARPYPDFYPGKEYVDILAADVYRNDFRHSHHDDLLELAEGKPIALGEVSHLPTGKILESQPKWLWVMPWGNIVYQYNSESDIKDFYNNPKLLSLS